MTGAHDASFFFLNFFWVIKVSVLLTTHAEVFSVSRMQDFSLATKDWGFTHLAVPGSDTGAFVLNQKI